MRIGQKLSIPLGVISLGHLVNGIFNGENLFYYLVYVGMFAVLAVSLLVVRGKRGDLFLSYSLLLFSLVGTWLGTYTDINSMLLLIFSIHITGNNRKKHIVFLSLFGLSLIGKYTYLKLNIPQLLVFVSGCSALVILYYHYMFPQLIQDDTPVLFEQEIDEIDPKVVEIMNLRCQDFDWWPISAKLNLGIKGESVRSIMSKEKQRLNIINPEAFTYFILSETRKNRQEAESDGFQDKNMV